MKTLFVKWFLRRLEDKADLLAAKNATAEGGEPIAWEEVEKLMGIN